MRAARSPISIWRDWSAKRRLRDAINAHLRPRPVAVLKAEEAADDFGRRASMRSAAPIAMSSSIAARPRPSRRASRPNEVAIDLDAAAMHLARSSLLGRHDFTTFRAAPVPGRNRRSARSTKDRGHARRRRIVMDVAARSFLHSQVRAFAGSLKLVGEGRWPPEEIRAALAAADRAPRCGPVAPPTGSISMQGRLLRRARGVRAQAIRRCAEERAGGRVIDRPATRCRCPAGTCRDRRAAGRAVRRRRRVMGARPCP